MHARATHPRDNMLHNITAELARGYTSVTIQDLNVAGTLQLRALARHVCDAAVEQFRTQLEDTAPRYRTQVVVADRWFPSSKTCSGCGTINANLKLADRVDNHGTYGLVIDQDVNAAVNLATPRHHRKPRHHRWPPDARTASAPGWAGSSAGPPPRHPTGPWVATSTRPPARPGGGWKATKDQRPTCGAVVKGGR